MLAYMKIQKRSNGVFASAYMKEQHQQGAVFSQITGRSGER